MLRMLIQPYTIDLQPMQNEQGLLMISARLTETSGPIVMETESPIELMGTFEGFNAGFWWDVTTGEGRMFTTNNGKIHLRGPIQMSKEPVDDRT